MFTSTPAPNPSSTLNLFCSPIIPTPISRRSIFVDITNQANAKEARITSLAHCLGDSIIDFFKRDQTPKPSKKTVVPRLGGECLIAPEARARVANALEEKALKVSNQAAAKKLREEKKKRVGCKKNKEKRRNGSS